MEVLTTIIVISLLIHLFSLLGFSCNWDTMFLTPRKIYHELDCLNWFGAIIIYTIYFCMVPLYAIIAFMIWACTVGRKQND